MRKVLLLVSASLLTMFTLPGAAHHSGSMFEDEKTVTLKGVVKEFQYTNPHSWLLVDVTDANACASLIEHLTPDVVVDARCLFVPQDHLLHESGRGEPARQAPTRL